MISLARSPVKLIRNASFLLIMFFAIILIFCKPALSCDVAIVSGKVTSDGRPLLWKNFDCSSYWKQEVKYFPAKNSTAGDYFLLYHNDDTMELINDSPVMPQSGSNAAGFAASVAAVYEDLAPLHESGNLNTDLLQHAVEECATLADWENLLKTWPSSHYNHAISANYVVVDAHGGAALYECYTGKYTHGLLKIQYRKIDANTGEIVDHTGNVISPAREGFPGYVARTNLNDFVWYNSGVDRYLRINKLLSNLAVKNPATGRTKLNAQALMQIVSKDVVGKQLQSGGNTKYSTTYCISRSQTRSGTVFQGVPAGGDPRQTIFWTALGEPSISVYVPNMIGAEAASDYVYMDEIDSNGDMDDNSDTCLMNIAEDQRETYNKLLHSSNRGSVLSGPYSKYINKTELAKVQQWTFAIENKVIAETSELLARLESNPGLMNPDYLRPFADYCGKYIYQNYIAGSATAVPWNYIGVPVTEVTLNTASLNLFTGESAALTASVIPHDATNPLVNWASSDPAVATVDESGKVTAVASGTAIITVTTADGTKTANCSVTVVPGTGVTLDSIAINTLPNKLVYNVGDKLDITGIVVTGTYSNNSTRIETVTTADVLGFNSSATATSLTLTVTVGGKTATFTVEIRAAAAPVLDSIAITTLPSKLVYNMGDTLDITGMVVTGTYNDYSTRRETVTTADVLGFDSSVPAASQTLTVTIGGKTAVFTVEIKAPSPASLIRNAIAKFTPVTGNMTIKETLPYSGTIRINKIVVAPAAIDASKTESSTLTISTFLTSMAAAPVFPLAELITGPETDAVLLVSSGTLTEDADNYIITLTGVDCPLSLLNICCKTDLSPFLVLNISNQKLDCQIKISKISGRVVSVDNIKIVGTTNFITGTVFPSTFEAPSLNLIYDDTNSTNLTAAPSNAAASPTSTQTTVLPAANNTTVKPSTQTTTWPKIKLFRW